MMYTEIYEAKKQIEVLAATIETATAEMKRLEKEIRRAELNAEMNTIEAQMIKNNMLIDTLRNKFEDDAAAEQVIGKLKKENTKLNAEWHNVFVVYFNL